MDTKNKTSNENLNATSHKTDVSGSLQDIKDIIEFLQWVFRKIDKGDTPEETVRMLLMNRAKIDNIKFDSNETIFSLRKSQPNSCYEWKEGIGDCGNLECPFCRIEKCINALECNDR